MGTHQSAQYGHDEILVRIPAVREILRSEEPIREVLHDFVEHRNRRHCREDKVTDGKRERGLAAVLLMSLDEHERAKGEKRGKQEPDPGKLRFQRKDAEEPCQFKPDDAKKRRAREEYHLKPYRWLRFIISNNQQAH